jgi:hypothetical protein
MKKILIYLYILFFLGCSDSGEVFVQDQAIYEENIKCLALNIFPPNKELKDQLQQNYPFSKECNYLLAVSYKTGIVCNSNQNADKKALGLPSGYIRLEIKKDHGLMYTYYKDLKGEKLEDEVIKGFHFILEDLDISL